MQSVDVSHNPVSMREIDLSEARRLVREDYDWTNTPRVSPIHECSS